MTTCHVDKFVVLSDNYANNRLFLHNRGDLSPLGIRKQWYLAKGRIWVDSSVIKYISRKIALYIYIEEIKG